MKRSGFRRKTTDEITKILIARRLKTASGSTKQARKGKVRVAGHETSKELKIEIQALLRKIVIIRDGGCILRDYPQTGSCGGWRKSDGELILQAEHLHTRSNAASFSDTRLVVCLCQRHHIFYKPQHADEYYRIVRKHIGTIRSIILDRVQQDYSPHKVDLKLELVALRQELLLYNKKQ